MDPYRFSVHRVIQKRDGALVSVCRRVIEKRDGALVSVLAV